MEPATILYRSLTVLWIEGIAKGVAQCVEGNHG